MTHPTVAELAGLAAAWPAWCALHSLLIAEGPMDWWRRRAPTAARWYRLLYNGIAVLSLVPVVWWERTLTGPDLVQWPGWWRVVPVALLAAAIFLFVAGARAFDVREFLGVRQLEADRTAPVGDLRRDGILGVVRHPWYLSGLLLLWARNLDAAGLVTSVILSLYLIVGAHLEERKLVRLHGEAYRDYQRAVPMLVPWRILSGRSES